MELQVDLLSILEVRAVLKGCIANMNPLYKGDNARIVWGSVSITLHRLFGKQNFSANGHDSGPGI